MPWPVPQPGDLADRAASVFESDLPRVFALKNPGKSPAQVDARSNTSQLAVYARTVDMVGQDQWYFLKRNADELMPDTATDWLYRHGAIWGVPRIQAAVAIGNVVFSGTPLTAIPSGVALAIGSLSYSTAAAGTVGVGGTVSIPVTAALPGSAGSQPAATILRVVNPLGGLTTQTGTVDAGGLTGEDAETLESWRKRILAVIRNRGSGGSAADFERWAAEALPGLIVKAMSPGTGLVTVAFAVASGSSWRVPTGPEIAVVSAYVNDAQQRKPLGAPFIVVAGAVLHYVDFSLHLNPDTAQNRNAAVHALGLQILGDAGIGATLFMSRMDAALENASGEFSHERAAPVADVTAGAIVLSTLGTVTFT